MTTSKQTERPAGNDISFAQYTLLNQAIIEWEICNDFIELWSSRYFRSLRSQKLWFESHFVQQFFK